MRVGKEIYAKENRSFGISSLKKKHLKIIGNTVIFNFKGKSNQRLRYVINDSNLKNELNLLLKLEGDKLFQYIDEYEQIRRITDTDLNEYIKTYLGKDFTIKMFRTYGANYYFVKSLLRETRKRLPKNEKKIKKNILNAFKSTIIKLKHTKSVSKKSYVINFIINMYYNNPTYFIERKNDNTNEVLLDLLRKYKKEILEVSK